MHIDPGGGADTLVAVVIGAALATVGGLLAGRIESRMIRQERERNAGLLFGEILAGLNMILQLASEARGRGDPYGPVTMRVLKAAHRETQIYDRNRELLFAVRDPHLRARTHILLLQMGLTLDAVFEAYSTLGHAGSEGLTSLGQSFDFLQELREGIPALLLKYQRIAKYGFDAHDLGANQDINPLAQPRPAPAPETLAT